jgi:hypothetical protein
MAIDFGRMARGVATGYLGAKIANTEANDAMNADIIKAAGLNFIENTLPEWQKSEKNRKIAYNQVSELYGENIAQYMGQKDLFTGDGNDFNNIQNMLSERRIDKTKLKAMVDQDNTYQTRYESRAEDIEAKRKLVMQGLTNGKIGPLTAELAIGDTVATDATDVKPVEYETITTPGKQVEGAPFREQSTTEKFPIAFSTGTYSFDEVFPKSKNLDLSFSDIRQLQSESEKSFARNIIKKAGGTEIVPAGSKYLEGYDPKVDKDKTKYAMDRYKTEYIDNILDQYSNSVTEGKQASTYAIPPGTKVSDIVTQARARIVELESQYGDNAEPYIEQIKSVVNEQLSLMNIEPSDFGF